MGSASLSGEDEVRAGRRRGADVTGEIEVRPGSSRFRSRGAEAVNPTRPSHQLSKPNRSRSSCKAGKRCPCDRPRRDDSQSRRTLLPLPRFGFQGPGLQALPWLRDRADDPADGTGPPR